MTLVIEPLPVPLHADESGTIRVGDTRIPLERVIETYRAGNTPEAIVEQFDVLRLADVYAVLGYYLTHEEEVNDYLHRQEELGDEVQRQVEALMPPRPGLVDELQARLARRGNGNAPPGQ